MIGQFEKEKEELENQLSNLQRERDNSLLMAENDKQQVNTSDWVIFSCGRSLRTNCPICREKEITLSSWLRMTNSR